MQATSAHTRLRRMADFEMRENMQYLPDHFVMEPGAAPPPEPRADQGVAVRLGRVPLGAGGVLDIALEGHSQPPLTACVVE